MEIEKLMIPIEKIINNSEECFAHVSKDGKQKETLKEHTERCQKYWKNLVEKKNLMEILEEFEKRYFNSAGEKVKEIFESMTVNIVTMHDIGKVNPEFQKKKMNHLLYMDITLNEKVGSKHSIISSVFYLDYYIGVINLAIENENICKSDGEKLKDFAYIYSYIISRHHGDLNELERYLESIKGKQAGGDDLGYQARNWYELWKKSIMRQGEPEKIRNNWKRMLNRLNGDKDDTEKIIYLYCLTRLLYSLLVAADYYATTEYMDGFKMTDFGELNQWEHIIDTYEKSKVQTSIRKYEKENYPMQPEKLLKEENINILRTEMFLDAERTLEKNIDKSIFYLEAPTGSGKSNTAINLSLKMIKENEEINKIFYIYPFNTLVEQNMETMEKVFGQDKKIMSQIAIVNSLVPLKKDDKAEEDKEWNKILLDRQFLNYPIVLSTHVMLFQTLFGNAKDNVFGFHQLSHSVIILDEIQSYKNDIWSEIITFLKGFANLMHMKIVIMSATLPNLEVLTDNKTETVRLIEYREKFFNHKKFAKRVWPDYSLLGYKITKEELQEHVLAQVQEGKKILIEFIKKKSAEEFYRNIREKSPISVLLMTGDSCILDRKRIIRQTKEMESVILIATQVIEAGVDIDMDIGYKDISRLDSEEQFMGRINRSGKKEGVVYFFDMDDASAIYKNDVRIEKDKTLENEEIRQLLLLKNFPEFYESKILPSIKKEGEKINDKNLEEFFCGKVALLNMPEVAKRMRLIDDNRQMVSVYLGRIIQGEKDEKIDGRALWQEYKELIEECKLEYAEKKIKLHDIRSQMNGFIYQFSNRVKLQEDEQIGDIFFIENGERYFDENGVLMKELFEDNTDLFI